MFWLIEVLTTVPVKTLGAVTREHIAVEKTGLARKQVNGNRANTAAINGLFSDASLPKIFN